MSRRLTISSLLCDDDDNNNNNSSEPRIIPEPVVLAPHLRRSPQRVEGDLTKSSTTTTTQPTASSSSKLGLHALVHAASAVAAAEERTRVPAPSPPSTSWSSESYGYTYSAEHLQRHQQQLEQRHVHREQILGYNDHHRAGRKADALGPGMRNILSPVTDTPLVSRISHDDDEHLDKKRRYAEDEYEYERQRQQQEESDRYRRTSITALTSPPLPSRRAGAGYDPVHENDHQPALRSVSHWDRIQSPSQQFAISQERPQSRSDAPVPHLYLPTSSATTRSPHFHRDILDSHASPPSLPPPPPPQSFPAYPHQARNVPQQQHRVISPIGRRSPPGSQAGRAIAAKKVEQEHQMLSMESVLRTSTPAAEEPKPKKEFSAGRDIEMPLVKEEVKKKDRKPSRSKEIKSEDPGPSAPRQIAPPSPFNKVDDPHEWFLEQYADNNRQRIKRLSSTSSSAAVTPKSDPPRHSTTSPIAPKPTKSPLLPSPSSLGKRGVKEDDAMTALEQELDAELAEVVVVPTYDNDRMDVDVDQAVAELVDETIGTDAGTPATGERQHLPDDDGESELGLRAEERDEREPLRHDNNNDDKAMDVDVEDELLSLLDDRPNSRMSASAQSAAPSTSSAPDPKRSSKPKLPASRMKNEEGGGSRPSSPLAVSTGSPFRSTSAGAGASASATGARQSSARPSEQDDRESMPPPPSTPIEKPESAVAAAQPKKKGKPGPKPKPKPRNSNPNSDSSIIGIPPPPPPSSKPRAKPGPKPKPRDEYGNIIRSSSSSVSTTTTTPVPPTNAKSGRGHAPTQMNRTFSGSGPATALSNSGGTRSRSTSVHPGGSVGSVGPEMEGQEEEKERVEGKEKEEEEEEDDDKVYCLCKTKYDEDKPMIACDSCDEWYHMKCVEIPEYMGDLVDQFFCPPCIEKTPSADLKTTYKPRCLFGINSLDSGNNNTKACHKPARPFSKYCSDECGVKNLRKRIDTFTKKGGKKEDLWESVKSASKREGLVRVISSPSPSMQIDVPGTGTGTGNEVLKPSHPHPSNIIIKELKPTKTKQEREIERLNGLLGDIERIRDELHRGMDIIQSREKLLQLATDRSENLGKCGWDQRLCFSDEDWADYGEGVLESYAGQEGDGEDDDDENGGVEEAEWWCPGDQECERHAGWQSLRVNDLDKEKEKKEEALFKLTSREREIRKRIDRIEEQDAGPLLSTAPRRTGGPPKSNKLSNGHATKAKVNGDTSKKGKKRKAVSG